MAGQEIAATDGSAMDHPIEVSSSALVIREMHSRSLVWKVTVISACLLFGSTNVLSVAQGSEYAGEGTLQVAYASAPEGGFLMNPTIITETPESEEQEADPEPQTAAKPRTAPKTQPAKKSTQVATTKKVAPPRKATVEILNTGKGTKCGAMVWPVAGGGRISQGYGVRRHTGVDISYKTQENKYLPIMAADDGKVVKAATSGWNGGYGSVVIIQHAGGYQTLYGHNRKVFVKVGETVKRGQKIAEMGNTGRVAGMTGIHLHFEVTKNGKRMNPSSCF